MALARIDVPAPARRGEIIEVRILIQHPMETGFRRDAGGTRVPRNAIHSVACKCNGQEVFRATLSSGVAANPSIRFFMRAVESGEMELWWLDDEDVEGTFKSRLVVT